MCRNGKYTERGIKGLDGFASQWWTIEPAYAVKVPAALGIAGVLVEPASVVAKAWDQIERVGARSWFEPKRALITGAGPIGLLAAMLGVQRGLEVHVLDRAVSGPKPEAVASTRRHLSQRLGGAGGHASSIPTSSSRPPVPRRSSSTSSPTTPPTASSASPASPRRAACSPWTRGWSNRNIVLDNDVVLGSVNAGLRHYEAAVHALAAADPLWLERLLTRQVPLERFAEALTPQPGDIKVVLTL